MAEGLRLGCRVWGIRFRVSGFGFRVSSFEFRVSGFGFRVSGFGCRVSGFGCRVSGFGLRVWHQVSLRDALERSTPLDCPVRQRVEQNLAQRLCHVRLAI